MLPGFHARILPQFQCCGPRGSSHAYALVGDGDTSWQVSLRPMGAQYPGHVPPQLSGAPHFAPAHFGVQQILVAFSQGRPTPQVLELQVPPQPSGCPPHMIPPEPEQLGTHAQELVA